MDYRVLFLQLYRFLSTFSFSFISLKRKLLTSVSSKIIITDTSSLIVIVNLRFLQRPQKRSQRNQLIHSRLSKTKLIGSGSDPESQASRQSDGYGGWCLELMRGGKEKRTYKDSIC